MITSTIAQVLVHIVNALRQMEESFNKYKSKYKM